MQNFIIILFSLFLFASTSKAQTTHYECSYLTSASLDENDNPELSSEEFKLSFLLDENANTAYIMGNAGTEKVLIIRNNGGISFIGITDTGNVSITTIANNLKSVHSRNTILPFPQEDPELIPSQYYGGCVSKQ
ncbi:hypothetical protein N9D02_11495 [Emcibacteraceae bacterium]|nr:hypothetical protein [Emcibacteraceae bacterium]